MNKLWRAVRSAIGLGGIGVLCLILAGCGGGGSSGATSAAGLPSFSASPGSTPATAVLTWDAPNQDMGGSCINVTSYQISYGTSADNLSQTTTVPAGSVSCTNTSTTNACGPVQSCTYSIANLASGVWYFAVEVTDTAGQQSGESAIASATLP